MAFVTQFSDGFTRTGALSGSSLDLAGGGALSVSWTEFNSGLPRWVTAAGLASAPSGGSTGVGIVADAADMADVEVGWTVQGSFYAGAIARWSAGSTAIGDFYLLFANDPGGTLTAYKALSGSFTNLHDWSGVITAGDLVKLRVQGSTLTAVVNGSDLSPTVSDGTFSTGKTGMYGTTGGNVFMDDFTVGYDAGGGGGGPPTSRGARIALGLAPLILGPLLASSKLYSVPTAMRRITPVRLVAA